MDKSAQKKPKAYFLFFRSLAVIFFDVCLAYGAMLGAVRWRYDFLNKPIPVNIDHRVALIGAFSTLLIWIIMRQDRAIWRFTSLTDFKRLLGGVFIVSLIVPMVMFLAFERGEHYPRSTPFISAVVFMGLIIISRLVVLMAKNGDFRILFRSQPASAKKALLIGPAEELHTYLNSMMRNKSGMSFNPVGLIETTGQHKGRSIRSVPVLGHTEDLTRIYKDISGRQEAPLQLISVDPNPSPEDTAQLIKIAANIGAPLARNTADMGGKLSAFEAADLIGREIRYLDLEPVRKMFCGRNVLITGAGGSIGSELSEQIMALGPQRLTLVDISEFNLYSLEHKLAPLKGAEDDGLLKCYIGDVTNAAHMSEIFDQARPEIVLHAAAMKHVPIGEQNPIETLRTNVLGTHTILDMCEAFGAKHFILISTDKAVNPANIMGASKRVVEMLTQARQALVPTMQAAAVRFGNVLASRGSVVNLFEEQIAMGGPVSVTHPDAERYFMSVEEATALVLQAAALGRNMALQHGASSNIYVLEMGDPVNIARLARQLIRMRGKVPDADIEVRFTGLRPGEKIRESLAYAEENLADTHINGIQRHRGEIVDPESIIRRTKKLLSALERRDRRDIHKALQRLLPDYASGEALGLEDTAEPIGAEQSEAGQSSGSNVAHLDVFSKRKKP